MPRRVLVVALFVAGVLVFGMPRVGLAQCTNIVVHGPDVGLSRIPCYTVSVTPDGTVTPSRTAGTSGYTAVFTVKNTGFNSDTYTFSCQGSLGVTCSSFTPTSKTLASNATVSVTATYAVSSTPGTGRLQLTATSVNSSDIGYYSVPIVTYGVSVTPDGSVAAKRPANTTGYDEVFTVQNTGSVPNTYTLNCTSVSGVTCSRVSASTLTLAANTSQVDTAFYNVGAIGTGTLTLTASGTNATDNGSFSVPIVAVIVAVTPDGSNTAPRPANTGGYSEAFTVTNNGTASTSFTLTCTGATGVTCGTLPVTTTPAIAPNGGTYSATVPYSVGAPQTGRLTLTASAGGVGDQGYYNVPIPGGLPVVVLADGPYGNQDLSRCAVGCFAATYEQRSIPYFAMGAPQAVVLVYHGDRAKPRPFVHVDVHVPTGSAAPTDFWLQVKINGVQVTFVNGETTLKFQGTATTVRLGGQFDGSSYSTGVYPLDLTVTSEYPTGSVQTTISTKLAIVNEASSPIAGGWTLGGIERLRVLADSSLLVTDGRGSAWVFTRTCPTCTPVTYVAPGDISQILPEYDPEVPTQIDGWRRVFPDSTRTEFNPQGFMWALIDRFGNVEGINYDASLRPSQIQDPLGRIITLTYGAHGLSTIQDPTGRKTTLTVQAGGNLTQITDPDSAYTGFGYDTNGRLNTITDRAGNTTTLGYAPSWKLATVTSPAVPILGSGTISPVKMLSAWQAVGVPYGSTNTPVVAPMPDTIQATLTEPGGAVSRFTANGWGQAMATTNAMGGVTIVSYDGNGLPLVTVRPTYPAGQADTTVFASNGLLLRTHLAGRPAVNVHYSGYAEPDSIWGDSLPTQGFTLGPRGQVLQTRIAGVLRQRTTYDSRGRIDSIFDATAFLSKTYYDVTNGNIDSLYKAGGDVARYTYDVAGRAVTLALPGRSPQSLYYSSINRLDSTRTSSGGSVRVVRYGYDPLRLTSVTDAKGQIYGFNYNALGWLTRRIDPAGLAEQDAYSLDGDALQWTNRRGQVIVFAYDSLHRLVRRSGTNTDSVAWTYSAPGAHNVTAVSPTTVETRYFGVRGQLDSVKTTFTGTGQSFWRRYSYNLPGYLVATVVAGGGITWASRQYGYNMPTGALKSLTIAGRTTTQGLDANFLPDTTALPGGDVVSRAFGTMHVALDDSTSAAYGASTNRWLSFGPGGRVVHQFTSLGSQPHARAFTYDSLGQIAAAANQILNVTLPPNCLNHDYGYDCEDNINSQWTSDSVNPNAVAFGYDSAGNRTDQGGTYAAGNRLVHFNGCAYGADADGNVTNRTCSDTALSATFSWTAEDQLRSVATTHDTTTFRYDAGGRLVRVEKGGVASRHFLWDGANLLAELDSLTTAKLAEYSYYPGLDRPHAVVWGTSVYYAQTDGIGNVVALTDSAKAVKRSYSYDEWGSLTGGQDAAGFSGIDLARWKSALAITVGGRQFYYMRGRWYEPYSGRFLSEDPLGLGGGLNGYTYANNDPVNQSDAGGLDGGPPSWMCQLVACASLGLGGLKYGSDLLKIAAHETPASNSFADEVEQVNENPSIEAAGAGKGNEGQLEKDEDGNWTVRFPGMSPEDGVNVKIPEDLQAPADASSVNMTPVGMIDPSAVTQAVAAVGSAILVTVWILCPECRGMQMALSAAGIVVIVNPDGDASSGNGGGGSNDKKKHKTSLGK